MYMDKQVKRGYNEYIRLDEGIGKDAMIFGTEAGDPSGPICAIMVALYITQDSFGTACNVSGDNAIGVIVETIYRRFICKSSAQ